MAAACIYAGTTNILSSDLSSWQQSFLDNSFRSAEKKVEGLLAKYALAVAESARRKGPRTKDHL